MKRILLAVAVVLGAAAFLITATGASNGKLGTRYRIELDNAFGLVTGADFKVAGVPAGSIEAIDLDQKTLHAVVTVSVTQKGFGAFHADAFCQSRPQSLIGEYFIDCSPGSKGPVLKPGATIPVTRTESTIPADLLNDVMRLPYRQRFSLIINELGAAVAGRSGDLRAALRRAVPALTETDNLLSLLSSDSSTLQRLTADSNSVITALANNSKLVQNWIVEAGRNATDTATQRVALQQTFHKLPSFLEALKPNMAALGANATANIPVLVNLNAASGELSRLFTDIPGFAHASLPSLRSLGQASITGKQAVQAARPTIADLNKFAKPAPELAKNLSIVLPALDDRSRAVEHDPRSPGGKGYTGLEALLQYVFNQTLAINTFTQFGHQLTVDAHYDQVCSPYATPQSIADNIAKYKAGQVTTDPRSCFGWTGPNQPGINEPDPSNPGACVPAPGAAPTNPGGYEVGYRGPSTSACQLPGSSGPAAAADKGSSGKSTAAKPGTTSAGAGGPAAGAPATPQASLQKTLGQILGAFNPGDPAGGALSGATGAAGAATSAAGNAASGLTGSGSGSGASGDSGSGSGGGQTQQLLNYLLAP